MLEAELGRLAPSVNSMRILGARTLPESPATVEALNVSWSTHSKTGRIADAARNTHFKSSPSAVIVEGVRREGRKHDGQDQGAQDSEPFLFHFALPPRCSVRRGLGFRRCFHRELCRARNGLIRKPVGSIHFKTVLPR